MLLFCFVFVFPPSTFQLLNCIIGSCLAPNLGSSVSSSTLLPGRRQVFILFSLYKSKCCFPRELLDYHCLKWMCLRLVTIAFIWHFPVFSINDITPTNQEGIELIFFKVAYMCYMLDVMKTVLITQWCFTNCWTVLTQHQGLFLFPTLPCQGGGWGLHKEQEGDPELTKRVLYTIWYHA